MPTFRLSKAAAKDLIRIHASGINRFGGERADAYVRDLHGEFAMLAEFPQMALARTIGSRDVRVFPFMAHVIIYAEEREGIRILRVRHGRENWVEG